MMKMSTILSDTTYIREVEIEKEVVYMVGACWRMQHHQDSHASPRSKSVVYLDPWVVNLDDATPANTDCAMLD